MGLNKTSGNMYDFITHTWNPVKGKCIHDCFYCYMKSLRKRFKQIEKPSYLDDKEWHTNLGKNNFIFVGSSCDMWAENIPDAWICSVLAKIKKHTENKYLFQSKNPHRFLEFESILPENCIAGTTIETNRYFPDRGKTPSVWNRIMSIGKKPTKETFVTIEPIINFDVNEFVGLIKTASPDTVFIGANTSNSPLPEPPAEKVIDLISELIKFTQVVCKTNLNRILAPSKRK